MKVPFHHFGLNESIPYPDLTWNELHDSEGPFITAENDERFPVAKQDADLIDVWEKFMSYERQELRKIGLDEPMIDANEFQKVIAIGKQNWW